MILEPVLMWTHASVRLSDTDTKKRSSASSNTSTSSSVGVPTSWRHTWYGRIASSLRT